MINKQVNNIINNKQKILLSGFINMALPVLQWSVSEEPEEICFPGFSSSGPGDADEETCKEIELKALIIPKTDGMAV